MKRAKEQALTMLRCGYYPDEAASYCQITYGLDEYETEDLSKFLDRQPLHKCVALLTDGVAVDQLTD